MMWNRLSLITAPASKPVTLIEAKAHLRVTFDDDDTLINGLIAAATASIDGPRGIGFALITQTWKLSLDEFKPAIVIPLWPVSSVSSVKYYDADGVLQTIGSSDYTLIKSVEPAIIIPAYNLSWPVSRSIPSAVEVTFVAGASSAPDDLKQAVLLLVGHWYQNREAITNGIVSEIPIGVQSILDRYRSGMVAA